MRPIIILYPACFLINHAPFVLVLPCMTVRGTKGRNHAQMKRDYFYSPCPYKEGNLSDKAEMRLIAIVAVLILLSGIIT